jgi:hypothetical protein
MEEEEQQQQQEQEQEQEPEKEGRGREGVRLFGVRRIPFISKETYYTCVKRDPHMCQKRPTHVWRIPFISRGVQVQKKDCKFSGLVR